MSSNGHGTTGAVMALLTPNIFVLSSTLRAECTADAATSAQMQYRKRQRNPHMPPHLHRGTIDRTVAAVTMFV